VEEVVALTHLALVERVEVALAQQLAQEHLAQQILVAVEVEHLIMWRLAMVALAL
jgi:hypothetical protein